MCLLQQIKTNSYFCGVSGGRSSAVLYHHMEGTCMLDVQWCSLHVHFNSLFPSSQDPFIVIHEFI